MKDSFITNDFIIDLSQVKTNFTEENPRFKDSFWTKYTLPVVIDLTRNFQSKSGHYSSFTAMNLKRYHEGFHIFEGKMFKGKLEVLDIKKNSIQIQIDSGFETLPNFDTKLSALPLEKVIVTDIYNHANQIVLKKYPDTNYNFPKLITDEFDLDKEAYKYFDGFVNNRSNSALGKVFPRNAITNGGMDVENRNIIQPLPYLLYVLKKGFEDAGFILQGEILEDIYLKQRCIYSSEKYYNTGDQEYQKANVFDIEYYDNQLVGGVIFGTWKKEFKINAPGKYRVIGYAWTENNGNCVLTIKRNGVTVITYGSSTTSNKLSFDIVVEVSIAQAEQGVTIELVYFGVANNDRYNNEGVNMGVARIDINPIRQNTASGDAIPFIFNENMVDLQRAVPDMTFGDLVTTVKNWRNYDLVFENNRAIMNVIRIDKTKDPEDFRKYEISDPVRKFTDKQSFILKFPEVEGVNLENIYYDETGYFINKQPVPESTTEIPINGFCLPLEKFRGVTTAKIFRESSLMLVYYDGLDNNGDNHAKNPVGLHGTTLALQNKDWYMNRLTNMLFRWVFKIPKSKMRNYNIRTEIFCYQKKHWIKSWVKNTENTNYYSVEIETETF